MQRVILLTEQEYQDLKSASPSGILEQTLANFKAKCQQQSDTITALDLELQTYILGGATKKQSQTISKEMQDLKDYVNTYNIVAHAIQTKAVKPVIDLTASYFQIDPTMLKRILKDAVSNNLLERTKDNTYILKDS